MFLDVAVSLSNFNKWTKKRIPSARLSPSPFAHIFLSQFSKIDNWHDAKNALLNILIIFWVTTMSYECTNAEPNFIF